MRAVFALVLLYASSAHAGQADDPVKWSAKVAAKAARPGATLDVTVTGVAEDEWHVYSVTQGPGGPVPTTITIGPRALFTRAGAIRGPRPTTAYDPNFEIKTETYDGRFALVNTERHWVSASVLTPLQISPVE